LPAILMGKLVLLELALLPTSACLDLFVLFRALLLNVLPELLCFSSWADLRHLASATAKASRRLGAALGLWLTTRVVAG